MRYIKRYTMKEWGRFNIETQEKLCTKYNITLTDYKTDKEKAVIILKQIGHIGMVMGKQSLEALNSYSNQPKKKRKKRRAPRRDNFL